jgi:predicted ATPase
VANVIGARADTADAIGNRQMLLVLDNLEQVIEAGPDILRLLEDCPQLQLVVTSRELLRVRGEVEYAVPPLAGPEAVALFAERSGRTDERVAELCRRLDNLPLAVELAAARARLLTSDQILDRLGSRLDLFRGGRDVDPRQATLRGAIDWSHELLAPEEQRVFAALAVFRGDWTVEAAEDVTGGEVETIASLADKSLVTHDGDRFGMLETIRAYADERLRERQDSPAISQRHAAHFCSWAERRYGERYAAEDTWVPDVTAETDNLRAALEWAVEHDPPVATALAGAVAPLWMTAGRAGEARSWLGRALDAHAARDASGARALMHLAELNNDLAGLSEALEIWRGVGDAEGEAATLEALGWVHDALGEYDAAASAHEASLAVRRDAGSPEVRGLGAWAGLCHVLATNRPADARDAARALREVARHTGAAYMEQLALHFLADADLLDGDWPAARAAYREALAFAVDHEFVGRAIDEVTGMAMAMAGAGRPEDALRTAAGARAKLTEMGKGTDAWWLSMQERHLGDARAALSEADAAAAQAAGVARPFETVVAELLGRERDA